MVDSIFQHVLAATGEAPAFKPGDKVRVGNRSPIGHYRVPIYLRGKTGTVIKVVEPWLVDNEEEGYGRNAGNRRHYYRITVPMTEMWTNYEASPRDELQIEVYETWLERLP